jgi:hypothetical protein
MTAVSVCFTRWNDRCVRLPRWVVGLPQGLREGVVGAAVLGAVGGVIGLIIGLVVNPPTAWAATFEIGLPAAFIGFMAGGAAGVASRNDEFTLRRPDLHMSVARPID